MTDEPDTTVLAVLEAVATADGRDPLDLPSLSEAVDPQALNALFDPSGDSRAPTRVSFDYAGYEVTVDRDRGVVVVPADAPTVARTAGPENARSAVAGADEPLAE